MIIDIIILILGTTSFITYYCNSYPHNCQVLVERHGGHNPGRLRRVPAYEPGLLAPGEAVVFFNVSKLF